MLRKSPVCESGHRALIGGSSADMKEPGAIQGHIVILEPGYGFGVDMRFGNVATKHIEFASPADINSVASAGDFQPTIHWKRGMQS
jgi:hypothetical protein